MEKKLKYIDNHAIGQRMRYERERLGFTREHLAEIVDLAPLYIGQLERGERQMSLDTLYKITESLNVSSDFLLHGNPSESDAEKERIYNLLDKCNKEEVVLLENVIRSMLSFMKKV